jgi:hypothetical protein
LIRIPEGPLVVDDLELSSVFEMKRVNAGYHKIKVEMFEGGLHVKSSAKLSRESF